MIVGSRWRINPTVDVSSKPTTIETRKQPRKRRGSALAHTQRWPRATPDKAHAAQGKSGNHDMGRWPPTYDVMGRGSHGGKCAGPTSGPSPSNTAAKSS